LPRRLDARPDPGSGSTRRTGWSIPGTPSAATSSLLVTGKRTARAATCYEARRCRHRRVIPAGQRTRSESSLDPHVPGLSPERMGARLRSTPPSEAEPPLDPPSAATTQTTPSELGGLSSKTNWRQLRTCSLDRSSSRLLAPRRLGFESGPRRGSARGPSPAGSSPTQALAQTPPALATTAKRSPPVRHRSAGTDELTSRLELRRALTTRGSLQRAPRQRRPPGRPPRSGRVHSDTEAPGRMDWRRA
jgi:hypothetical protein